MGNPASNPALISPTQLFICQQSLYAWIWLIWPACIQVYMRGLQHPEMALFLIYLSSTAADARIRGISPFLMTCHCAKSLCWPGMRFCSHAASPRGTSTSQLMDISPVFQIWNHMVPVAYSLVNTVKQTGFVTVYIPQCVTWTIRPVRTQQIPDKLHRFGIVC
jgi:hypothetical protein